MIKRLKNLLKPRLKLIRGARFTSFLFIGCSVLIAAGILWAANMYYNIDTGEVVTEEIQRVTGVLRATASVIVGGTATQDPTAGYVFEVVGQTRLATTTVATGLLELTAANQELRFTGGTSYYYTGFKATTTLSTTTVYAWPGTYPAGTEYYLTANPTTGQMSWGVPSGAGDIIAVGNVESGAAFTGTQGNILYFEGTGGGGDILLTGGIASSSNVTVTIPGVAGTLALGTGAANQVAYWSDTNTLAGTSTLPTTMGGTGQDSSAWNGMVRVVGNTWGAVTGTAGYAAYWSDANTVAAEQNLATSRGGLGANVSAAGAGEILYSTAATTYGHLAAGNAWQILTSGGAAIPAWKNISELVYANNGLTISGTATTTLKLGGTLTGDTTIALGAYNMIFNMTGIGNFKVQDDGTNILTVTDDGRILFKTYPLAETGKQVLREMIPVFGFDLPSQTATTSYVQISRVIEDYPFSPTSTGATRVHKFVIRYADATTTASTTWRVYNVTDSTTTATFTVPPTATTTLAQGEVYITGAVDIPTTPNKWWRLDLYTPGTTIRVYQIFLAAYDKID